MISLLTAAHQMILQRIMILHGMKLPIARRLRLRDALLKAPLEKLGVIERNLLERFML